MPQNVHVLSRETIEKMKHFYTNALMPKPDQLGITLPKGASKNVDQTIEKVINTKGEALLNTCVKTHFGIIKKARLYL